MHSVRKIVGRQVWGSCRKRMSVLVVFIHRYCIDGTLQRPVTLTISPLPRECTIGTGLILVAIDDSIPSYHARSMAAIFACIPFQWLLLHSTPFPCSTFQPMYNNRTEKHGNVLHRLSNPKLPSRNPPARNPIGKHAHGQYLPCTYLHSRWY